MRRGAHAHDPISRIKSAKQIYTWINRAKIIVPRARSKPSDRDRNQSRSKLHVVLMKYRACRKRKLHGERKLLTLVPLSSAIDFKMKILTWNINGIRASKVNLVDLFKTLDADVICLQETKVTREFDSDAQLSPYQNSIPKDCLPVFGLQKQASCKQMHTPIFFKRSGWSPTACRVIGLLTCAACNPMQMYFSLNIKTECLAPYIAWVA